MAALNTRRAIAGVALVVITAAGIAWAFWRHHPEGAVISVILVIGSVVSQSNRHLSRALYAVAGALVAAGVLLAALLSSQSGKLTGLLIMVAGVAGGMQVFFIRANHNPYVDEPTAPEHEGRAIEQFRTSQDDDAG